MSRLLALVVTPLVALDVMCEVMISLGGDIIHFIQWEIPEIISSYFDFSNDKEDV